MCFYLRLSIKLVNKCYSFNILPFNFASEFYEVVTKIMNEKIMESKETSDRLNNSTVERIEAIDPCRVCMAHCKQMNQIFNAESNNISDRIEYCTGIQLSKEDGLPSQICDGCLLDLAVAHKFKTLCILADETFRKVLIAKIKHEEVEVGEEVDEMNYDEEYCDESRGIKEELSDESVSEVRKSNRIKLKKENVESVPEPELKMPQKVRKKRGPYKKSGKPKRLMKFKFRKLWCEPCGMKFTSKEQSDEHKKDVHKDDSWVCEICGKLFIHRASHYTHIRSHLPPQYGCDRCDYKTWHKHDLVKHERIHTGVKQYQCEFCTSSFYTSSNLTCHIRRFHERLKRFHCTMCERSFYDRTKLNRHLDSHNEIKRFECEVCHACFTRRCYWKKHLLRQHGVDTPAQRPGRQKVNFLIGEYLINSDSKPNTVQI